MENIAELPATQVTAGQLADLIISRLATQKRRRSIPEVRERTRFLGEIAPSKYIHHSEIQEEGDFRGCHKTKWQIYPSGRKARSGKVLFQKDETTLTSLPAYGLIAPVTHKPEESTYNKNSPTRL